MTVESYIADKLDLISRSGGFKNLGKIARNAGSFVLGLMSNTEIGTSTTVANFDTRNSCY